MPENLNGSVAVPKWQIALLTGLVVILFSTAVAALVADSIADNKVIQDLRERVVRLETTHGLHATDGGR